MAEDSKAAGTTGGSDKDEFRAPPRNKTVHTALISGNTFRVKAVQYSVLDGQAIFEGDILLGTVEEVEHQSAQLAAEARGELGTAGVLISGDQFRWPDCLVPYDVDPNLPDQARVTEAINHWQRNTRFRFVERTAANAAQYPDWVHFQPGGGCSAHVGRRGGMQQVTLADGCTLGNTIHEIGHAVGFWHEQSREDRDAFVTINWANIQAGMEHNFNQHVTDGEDVGAYDYGSIMHYPRNAFGRGGAETITPTDPAAAIGQRTGLSAGDIAAANSMCAPVGTTIETLKEQSKELIGETIKERIPETAKERIGETIKERIPETVKELSPETIKERIPETVKELSPETIKERIPETVKERFETLVEGIGFPGPGPLQPQVVQPGTMGQVPFAVATPHAGAPQAGPEGYVGDEELAARVAQLELIVSELVAEHDAGMQGLQ
ncbi:Dot/Icm T4SS effector Zinc-dependent metalloprotease LegP [Ornithinimicrobium cavernae]|uniref:Dot/Icm T4SS effector Zinc-dependent metalloprotease LegP n=1 Tax=Ornithinimicrobium cavernae TaxID=2666047 RepID=UPI000D6969F6|nr:Dot/Icm T4SS effector Zinc-dependent metalloprotease LegP [Ornithinimicrobium cavernae]